MPGSADPYRTLGVQAPYREPAVMGPDIVVRVCKFCKELRSICDKRTGDDLSHLECQFKRSLEAHFADG